jgi:hypothetical protein
MAERVSQTSGSEDSGDIWSRSTALFDLLRQRRREHREQEMNAASPSGRATDRATESKRDTNDGGPFDA